MKRKCALYLVALILANLSFLNTSFAQAIDPNKSARAAAQSDAEFITMNIRDNEDFVYLAQKAVDKTKDERVKELAQMMLDDHLAMLYSLQQLQSAGGKGGSTDIGTRILSKDVDDKLSASSGATFDSIWVVNMLPVQQAKYDELTQAKETVTNPQLKMAVSEGLPKVRKHVSQLQSVKSYLNRLAIQKRKEEAAKKKLENSRG